MTTDFENLIKNEWLNLAQPAAKWSDVCYAAFGNVLDYIFVGPIDGLPHPTALARLLKGLGKAGAAAWFAKAGKMVTNVRSMAYEIRDDLSYNTR